MSRDRAIELLNGLLLSNDLDRIIKVINYLRTADKLLIRFPECTYFWLFLM